MESGSKKLETSARWTWIAAGLVALAALPPLLVRAHATKEWGDEGYFANGALRMLAGQVPYRDFQHNYPPGRAGLIALLVTLFGPQLIVVRSLWITFHAASAGMAVLLARRAVSLPFAVLTGLAVILNVVFLNKSVELFLSAWLLLVLVRVAERRTSDFMAGVAIGAGTYLRHDAAAFATALMPLALLLATRASLEGGSFGGLLRAWLIRIVGAWRFLVGMLLALAPVLIWLGWHGALLAALRDLTISGYIANKTLSKPFPLFFPRSWDELVSLEAMYIAPIFIYGAALLWGADSAFRRRSREGAILLLAAGLGALLFSQVLVRTDIGHLEKAYYPAHIASGVLLGVTAAAAVRALRSKRLVGGVALSSLAVVSATVIGTRVWHLGVENARSAIFLTRYAHRYQTVEMPRGSMQMKRRRAAWVQRMFSNMRPYADQPGETLVVYPAGALFNFVFGLENPLPYDILRPGELAGSGFRGLVPNNPEVLAELEAKLEAEPPRFLLYSGEDTNPEFVELIEGFAKRRGYRVIDGDRLRLSIRP